MSRGIFTIAVTLTFLCLSAGLAGQDLVILHVNDTHSHFEPIRSGQDKGHGGVIERAAYIDSVRCAEGRRKVLLLHAGDFSQGTSYFTVFNGDLEIEMLNAMGYDAVTIGNHEFDNGIDELTRRLSNLKCPVVCANYDFSAFELGHIIRPYTIVHRGGLKIGIFGLLTDISSVVAGETASKLPKFDDVETARKWTRYLREEKCCDMVIALTHIGFDGTGFTDPDLVRKVSGLDLVVGGHSHTFLKEAEYFKDPDGKEVPIVQDGCWGLYFGKIDVYKD